MPRAHAIALPFRPPGLTRHPGGATVPPPRSVRAEGRAFMVLGILLAVLTGLSFGGIAALCSLATRRRFPFCWFAALACAAASGVLCGVRVDWSAVAAGRVPRAALLLTVFLLVGALNAVTFVVMNRAMRAGHHGVIWTVAQSALVFPFASSVLVRGEPATLPRLLGLGCILGGLVAFGRTRDDRPAPPPPPGARRPVHWFSLALLCFAITGAAQVFTTIPSYWKDWADTARLRAAVLLAAAAASYTAIALARREPFARKVVPWAILLAGVIAGGHIALFESMDRLEKNQALSVLYPVAVGTSIVAFALYSRLALREPFGLCHAIGTVLCTVGLVAISL